MEINAVSISSDFNILNNHIFEQADNRKAWQQNQALLKNSENIHINEEQISNAVDQANKSLTEHSIRLQFSIHDKTKEIMVKVVDENTGEVIREIPPEKALDRLAMVLKEIGWLVDEKA